MIHEWKLLSSERGGKTCDLFNCCTSSPPEKKSRLQEIVSDTLILKEVVAWRCSGTCCFAKFTANHL